MNSKKAIILPETLKIIIAVMCIALLFVLASRIYSIFQAKTSIEQARAVLDEISKKIISLNEKTN